ncbi:helix-turn-helix domain-containing protein [Clostridium niameyense]|uniref:Helix-turn-helix domain-containing protein n=1 Tax=Clostridium niameyense TaxID=1622073 RepID=A0A6M0RDB8_9CLOT|nr:helix-turn-helix domain-containing protein [Clostridium niameyense]NEZ47807.1 helix-turn-helix domain-containing protein [Clostridium niameyense]
MDVNEGVFLDGLETNYFQVSNYIFDLEFIVMADKRIITKNFYGKGKHKYEIITEERGLNAAEKIVFIYLCRCANNGKTAFPSYKNIANNCSISLESARQAINVLADNKFILKKHRGYMEDKELQRTKNYSNIYKINNYIERLKHKEN